MSGSDTDDEKMEMILEAVDSTLLTDSMFPQILQNLLTEPHHKIGKKQKDFKTSHEKKESNKLKSQRYLSNDEDVHYADIKISSSMQDHLWKKLSEIISNQIEYVNADELTISTSKSNRNHENSRNYGVKLLNDSKTTIQIDVIPDEPLKRKKCVVKRRIIDETEDLSTLEQLKYVTLDGEYILSQKEIIPWSSRTRGKVFHYRTSKTGVLHFIEPENEFTKLRKKHCWSEKYISQKKMKLHT